MTYVAKTNAKADLRHQLSEIDSAVYDYHVEHCSDFSDAIFQNDFYLSSFANGLDWETAKLSASEALSLILGSEVDKSMMLLNKGQSSKLKNDLESLGYYYALASCFGNNEYAKNAYTIGLITSDFVGKLSLILPLKLTLKIYERLIKFLPTKLQVVFNGTVIGTSLIYLGHKLYLEYRPRTDKEKEIFFDISKNMFSSADEVLELNRKYFEELLDINYRVLDDENATIDERELATKRIHLLEVQLEKMSQY